MVSIVLDRIVKKFGEQTALDGISLRIEPGEIFFLLGPSGCGKTTLLRSIAGFSPPDSGTIHFNDENVTTLPPHQRRVGMMFQSYALWPHLTVAKNVAFGLEEQKIPAAEIKQRVREALQLVKMEDYGARKIAQLSGGQQQRVALARALVIRPRALLLDEPLSNLDAKLRLETRAEIRRVCKEFGLTAIYVTHDQKEALSTADRMAVLMEGRLVQVGRPEEIYRRPASRAVAEFIGETNFLSGRVLAQETFARVETEIGIFEGVSAKPDWQPQVNDPVTLSIRPESWSLVAQSNLPNIVRGRIGASTYLGELAQYEFLAGAHRLRIFELNPRAARRDAETDFFAMVAPEDVVILPD